MKEKQAVIQQQKEFGARFKEMRVLDFGDQKTLAEFLGLGQSFISQIESGKKRLMPEFRFKLAKEKKWSMKYLDFGQGGKHLGKDYFKKNLVTDIGDIKLEIDLLKGEIERLRADNTILLKMVQELKK